MKFILMLFALVIIVAGGYAVYTKTGGDITVDDIKKLSVEDMTDSIATLSNKAIEQLREVNTKELMEIAVENKEDILSFLEDNNISLENVDMEALNKKLEENGLSLEKLGVVKDDSMEAKVKEIIESVKK